MGFPHVTNFCCCMGLELGAKVIGFVHLALSLTVMVLCSVFAASAKGKVGTVEDAGDHLYTTWHTIAVIVAVISVAHVLLAATLIYSVFKRNPDGVRAWVWVMAALAAGALVFNAVVSALSGLGGSGSDIFVPFLEGGVFFGVLAYCIFCVNSYYMMLRSIEDMEGPNKTDY